MKKNTYSLIFCALISCGIISYLSGLSVWQQPDPRLRYNQVAFLTSHNSYAAKKHDYIYAQQYWTISEQLQYGARGIMLDTYESISQNGHKDIVLCHGGLAINRLIRKGLQPMSFKESLIYIKNFLHDHPQEIVTIFLENYVKDGQLLDRVIRSSGIDYFILKPSDWPVKQKACWPTLAWMQKHNKRLIIFNSLGSTSLIFDQWQHMIENRYGVLNIKRAACERRESLACSDKNRCLYLLNYFPSLKINFGNSFVEINSIRLKQLLDYCKTNGLNKEHLYKQRLPNFIAVDYINEGDAMHFINIINHYAKHCMW